MKDFIQSKKIAAVAAVLGILAVLLLIFEFGVTVGYRKAAFEYGLGNNYYRVFGAGGGMLSDIDDFPAAHGVSGTIIRISPPYAFIEGANNEEKAVRIGSTTTIVKYHSTISPNGIAQGDFIVVIGEPEASSSDINAHFIRVLPPPSPASTSLTQ